MTTPEFMTSTCQACTDARCRQAIKVNPATGRAFITMGHAGFNAPANNGAGYLSRRIARAVMARYLGVPAPKPRRTRIVGGY